MRFYLVLLLLTNLFSQRAFHKTEKIYSQNKQFHAQVKGGFYEGFSGDQEISLIDVNNDTLWKQIVPSRFLIYPSVSNKGDIAITHREVKIFDRYNNLKGKIAFKKGETPYHGIDYMGAVQSFSNEGDNYFIFLFTPKNGNDVKLACYSDSAQLKWEKDVEEYRPSEIWFYKDKIITHDVGSAGIKYKNYCYVFNLSGKIIWKYGAKFIRGSDWHVNMDSNKGVLYLKDTSAEIYLDLNTLSAFEY